MATGPGLWNLQGYPVQLPSKGFWFPDFAKKKKKKIKSVRYIVNVTQAFSSLLSNKQLRNTRHTHAQWPPFHQLTLYRS